MSEAFVADASVAIAWAVASQANDTTERLLDEIAAGRPLVVPALWPFEIANSLLVLLRRKRIDAQHCARSQRALARLNPLIDDDGPRLALDRIFDLATEHDLSVYDAAYLELALRRRLPLASRDEALNKAARDSSVRVLL